MLLPAVSGPNQLPLQTATHPPADQNSLLGTIDTENALSLYILRISEEQVYRHVERQLFFPVSDNYFFRPGSPLWEARLWIGGGLGGRTYTFHFRHRICSSLSSRRRTFRDTVSRRIGPVEGHRQIAARLRVVNRNSRPWPHATSVKA